MIKAVIFDLDNTLYNENKFVHSGFKYVTSKYFDGSKNIYKKLCALYDKSNQCKITSASHKIFDQLLLELGTYSKEKVMDMTYAYRFHTPLIELYSWVQPFLIELRAKHIKIGILTNGKTMPQYNKINKLSVQKFIDRYLICDILDFKYWKPHPLPYKILLNQLGIKPNQTIYVDDNKENIEIALEIGMHSILCKNNEELPNMIRGKINENMGGQ
jgi:putative hydrolase of the HAD superfamily